ncbi:MAG: DUF3795 domain-containing protein [Candidatus Lokiarchaeota archaeon]|nr:DUF3795 domain-containing protein [Candidatus Lokiarchaeota archaeon]
MEKINPKDLIAHCGLFCGACRTYLLMKKDLFEEKGYKRGCEGCIIRNKNCAFLKKKCPYINSGEVRFCYECDRFPCENLEQLDSGYQKRYYVSLIENLKRIQEIGWRDWYQEQKELYTCPECGGELCVHDAECFDCGYKYNPNK